MLGCLLLNSRYKIFELKKYSKEGKDRRKQTRSGYSEFFLKHVDNIKSNKIVCQECGKKLVGDVSEVAHILEKQKFNSLALADDNILYLCGWKTGECHSNFDGTSDQLQAMNVFTKTREKVRELLTQAEEKYNWKLTDRWQL